MLEMSYSSGLTLRRRQFFDLSVSLCRLTRRLFNTFTWVSSEPFYPYFFDARTEKSVELNQSQIWNSLLKWRRSRRFWSLLACDVIRHFRRRSVRASVISYIRAALCSFWRRGWRCAWLSSVYVRVECHSINEIRHHLRQLGQLDSKMSNILLYHNLSHL